MEVAVLLIFLLVSISLFCYFTVDDIPDRGDSRLKQKHYYINRNKFFLFLSFSLFYIIMAFRDISVGIDTETYSELYLTIANTDSWLFPRYETGYVLLNRIIGFIFPHSPQMFIVIISFIVLCGYVRFIYKYSYIPWLSVLFFFLFEYFDQSINLTRQGIAMVILLHAFDFLITRKTKSFFICVLCAGLFHYTALFFILAYIVNYIRFSKSNIIIFFCVAFLVALCSEYIIHFVFASVGVYADYANTVYADGNVRLASILHAIVILSFIIFTLIHISSARKYFETDSNGGREMFWLLMLGLLIWIASFQFNLLGRLAQYFTVYLIVFVPNLLFYIKKKNQLQFMFWELVLIAYGLCYYLIIVRYRPEWNGVYPYKFFFI